MTKRYEFADILKSVRWQWLQCSLPCGRKLLAKTTDSQRGPTGISKIERALEFTDLRAIQFW